VVYYYQRQPEEAINYYSEALVIYQNMGERAGEATTLRNIGHVHFSQASYDLARDYYNQALAISREIGDTELEQSVLDSIADLPDP